jgi:hypothetical protein
MPDPGEAEEAAPPQRAVVRTDQPDCPRELLPEGEVGEKTCIVALVGPGSSPSHTSAGEESGTWRFEVHERRLVPTVLLPSERSSHERREEHGVPPRRKHDNPLQLYSAVRSIQAMKTFSVNTFVADHFCWSRIDLVQLLSRYDKVHFTIQLPVRRMKHRQRW